VSTAGVPRLLAVTGLVVALLYALADRLVEAEVRGQPAQAARDGVHRGGRVPDDGEGTRTATPSADSELMLADSSQAHLKRVVDASEGGRASCGVTSPHDCPAVRRATTLVFRSSQDLDACPFLEGRPGDAVSATCVPTSVAGRSIAVLPTAGDDGTPPCGGQLERLEAIATHSGSRIGVLRVMAATDPLTGLLNRRSLDNRVHELNRRGSPFALAMGDLDHFKRLNDTQGHDAGDRALERLHEELPLALLAGNTPDFTVSFGVAHSHDASSFEELCRVADTALFRARREGRNRVVADQGVGIEQTTASVGRS
jgi:GGDEF domain-containing protein